MHNFFIYHPDIGYNDIGLHGNKYTALIYARRHLAKINDGKNYQLITADDKVVAIITARPQAPYKMEVT